MAEILEALHPRGVDGVRDVEAAAERITAILHGRIAPPRHNDRFLLSRMVADTLRVYEELLSSACPAPSP
ncbi:MAG: hypothetical protein V2I24_07140 [Halieaceae bacterium]|nr:hypothetical protein [Halieaceae bacterium]